MDATLTPDALAEILAAARTLREVCARHGAHVGVAAPIGIVSFHSGGALPDPVGPCAEVALENSDGRWIVRSWQIGDLRVDAHGARVPGLAVAS